MTAKTLPIGAVFGRLTVIGVGEPQAGNSTSECSCACGNTKTIRNYNLKNGSIKSCRCLHRDITTLHGQTPLTAKFRP